MTLTKQQKEIRNCLASDLLNLIMENESGNLTTEGILGYFSEMMIDAKVDPDIIIATLEVNSFFKDVGVEEARCIKVNLGY